MEFELATPQRIVFGPGRVSAVAPFLAELGARSVLLVTGESAARSGPLAAALDARGIRHTRYAVAGEPTLDQAREGARLCREQGATAVLACGGGGALDAGKAIAALAPNAGDVLDYVEVIGRAQPLGTAPLPFIAVPTTAGTGAEVTRNAVLGSKEHGVKVSLRSPAMLARLAVVDPDLLEGAPPAVLRASGLDALSQLVESFVSCRANPVTSALAADGIARSLGSLASAVRNGPSADERTSLALASLLGGLCLANAGLGAVHGFAAPIGGSYDAPHGAVCAALLPHVLHVNLRAVRARGDQAALARFEALARIVTLDPHAEAEAGVAVLTALCAELGAPGLSAYGVTESQLGTLVEKAERASSMRGNPLVLTRDELLAIARAAL